MSAPGAEASAAAAAAGQLDEDHTYAARHRLPCLHPNSMPTLRHRQTLQVAGPVGATRLQGLTSEAAERRCGPTEAASPEVEAVYWRYSRTRVWARHLTAWAAHPALRMLLRRGLRHLWVEIP